MLIRKDELANEPLLTKLGIEPISRDLNGQYVYDKIHKKNKYIKLYHTNYTEQIKTFCYFNYIFIHFHFTFSLLSLFRYIYLTRHFLLRIINAYA